MGGSQFRIFDETVQQQPEGRIQELALNAFLIEKLDSLAHIFQGMIEYLGEIKRA
jgi:hypothetical protein